MARSPRRAHSSAFTIARAAAPQAMWPSLGKGAGRHARSRSPSLWSPAV
jgi:hypothetical protein